MGIRPQDLTSGTCNLWQEWRWRTSAENARVQALLSDFAKRFPEDTYVKFVYVPTLRSTLALSHHDAAKALAELEPSRA